VDVKAKYPGYSLSRNISFEEREFKAPLRVAVAWVVSQKAMKLFDETPV
jgi:hypothetical protein